MERRCKFMENCPQLMFNSAYRDASGINTTEMRTTLLQIMLKEVSTFCQQTTQWSDVHQVQIHKCIHCICYIIYQH